MAELFWTSIDAALAGKTWSLMSHVRQPPAIGQFIASPEQQERHRSVIAQRKIVTSRNLADEFRMHERGCQKNAKDPKGEEEDRKMKQAYKKKIFI